MIDIRKFKEGDEEALWSVFYSSIHQVCSGDYSNEQIDAWAPKDIDPSIWINKFRSIKPFVATLEGNVVGYADLQCDGEIDHFFVHGDHQGKGVGTGLMEKIIDSAGSKEKLFSEVSHTAKPFFEKYGFKVIRKQNVNMRGVTLSNNVMERRN